MFLCFKLYTYIHKVFFVPLYLYTCAQIDLSLYYYIVIYRCLYILNRYIKRLINKSITK